MTNQDTQADALDALAYIPADLPRDEWVRVGMSMKSIGLTLDDFSAWSATAPDRFDARACKDTWNSFRGNGIGPGSLFALAKQHGWSSSNHGQSPRPGPTPPPRATETPPAPNPKAMAIWSRALPASAEHPYIAAKHGLADGLRVLAGDDSLTVSGQSLAGSLVVPAYDAAGNLQTLQFIPAGHGRKLNLPQATMAGASFIVGQVQPDLPLYLTEGIGQAWACHRATQAPAACCFGFGNIKTIASHLKAPQGPRLVVVPDAGKESPAAALASQLGIALARMPEGEANNFDANDLARRDGLDALRRILDAATTPAAPDPTASDDTAWPPPQPIITHLGIEPFPLDALPPGLRAVVVEVASFVQSPLAMCVSSALTALSLVGQGLVDVRRAKRLVGPTSLYLLIIAASGERKTATDQLLMRVIRAWEAAQRERLADELKHHKADLAAWTAEVAGLTDAIRAKAKAGKPAEVEMLKNTLRELQAREPVAPVLPRLLYGDVTSEALAHRLATGWPVGGIVSDEGGAVLGGHSLKPDNLVSGLALLNNLWSGTAFTSDRKTAPSFAVDSARATCALMVQAEVLRDFHERAGALASGSGLYSRFLVCQPESTVGSRFFREPPANWPALTAYENRLDDLLALPLPIASDGRLKPTALDLTPAAKALWVAFFDQVEGELRSGGELVDIKDTASKIAEQAARMAALFHLYAHGTDGEISQETMTSAVQVTSWYLLQARRFFGELALPAEIGDALRLDAWMLEQTQAGKGMTFTRREIQNRGPGSTRNPARLDPALKVLADLDRIRVRRTGKSTWLVLNPTLVEDDQHEHR